MTRSSRPIPPLARSVQIIVTWATPIALGLLLAGAACTPARIAPAAGTSPSHGAALGEQVGR